MRTCIYDGHELRTRVYNYAEQTITYVCPICGYYTVEKIEEKKDERGEK